MIDHGMDPQAALDAARFCIGGLEGPDTEESAIFLEEGMPRGTMGELRALGHRVAGPVRGLQRVVFGRGQVVCSRAVGGGEGRERANVWWGGSDSRGDGVVMGY